MPMCHFDEYGEDEEEEDVDVPLMKQPPEMRPTAPNPPLPSQPENQKSPEFVENPKSSSTAEPLMNGGWEKWEESGGSSEEEDTDGIGVHVESDSSQQLYYGSHQGQYNGARRSSFISLTLIFTTIFIASFYF